MALIVEDGTNVPDANTYADVATIRAYALSVGREDELPLVDADVEPLAINAMYDLETRCWQGSRTFSDQALSFPRTGLWYDGQRIPNSGPGSIPQQLIDAECQLALTANASSLFGVEPIGSSGPVIEERVEGAVTIKYGYTPGQVASTQVEDALADSLVEPFECGSFGLFAIRA